ncbi:MAG: PhnD/SsuA/transferrin family substrate-binding protein [Streptosporangiales bacterium]|nr:PhnD/SsuA/transferrin family substrate-binding protein [Streptosporangiales bacterium]
MATRPVRIADARTRRRPTGDTPDTAAVTTPTRRRPTTAGAAASGETSGEGEPTTVTVGTLPLASAAPLYLAREKGFFREQGIEVKPQLTQGGAEVAAGVQSGSFDFGYAGVIPILIAKAKGLPVKIVGTTDDQGKDAQEADVITVARKGSDIRTARDLEGATVGVNSLKGVAEVVIKTSVEKDGGDPSKVKLLEVPIPEMVTSLESEGIDAAFIPEPFQLQALQDGARIIENASYQAVDPRGFELGIYIASDQYVAENRDVVQRFMAALDRATEYAAAHPEEVRNTISTYTEIPPEVIDKIKLPRWDSELRRESVQLQAELTKRYGIVEELPNLDELIL